MRFYLDHDVDATCRTGLIAAGHEAWITGEAGRARTDDDEQTIYATDKHAILVTHDAEFTNKRKAMPFGHHVRLKCREWDAPKLLVAVLPQLEQLLRASPDMVVVVTVHADGTPNLHWWFGTENEAQRRAGHTMAA